MIEQSHQTEESGQNGREFALNMLGLGLNEITGAAYTTHAGERKAVASAGEVKNAEITRSFIDTGNGTVLVIDDDGHVYQGAAGNESLRTHLEDHNYRELSGGPLPDLYSPLPTDRRTN